MTPTSGGGGGRRNQGPEETVEGKPVSPWSCARAEFRIQTPEKDRKQRRRLVKQMKRVAANGLNSAPYVEIQWVDEEKEVALFDTGV